MSAGESIFNLIKEESIKEEGTWSYAFMQDVRNKTKKLTQKQLELCFSLLINFIISNESTSLQKYKTAQIMSYLKFNFLIRNFECFDEKKTLVEKFITEYPSCDSLAVAAKKLVVAIFASIPERTPTKVYAHSSIPFVYV